VLHTGSHLCCAYSVQPRIVVVVAGDWLVRKVCLVGITVVIIVLFINNRNKNTSAG